VDDMNALNLAAARIFCNHVSNLLTPMVRSRMILLQREDLS
jgi:hypothetical protein